MSEWKEKIIGEICRVKGGKRLPAGKEFSEGVTPFPYLRVTDMIDGTIDSKSLVYVKPEIEPFIRNYKISKDDLYVTIAGTLGLFGSIPINLHNAQLTENAAKLCEIDTGDFNKDFLKYYFNSEQIQSQINKEIGVGGGVPKLALYRIERLLVKYPELPTQRKIAHILSTADAVIEKTQAAIAKYKAIKQGMLHDLFTRGIDLQTNKLRPKYEDTPELYKESKLGWIPKEWEELQINDCVDAIMSNVDKHIYEDEIKILLCNYMDVYDNRYLTRNISFSNGSVNPSEMQRFSLKPQDVIITKDSETPDDIAVPTVVIEKIENLICGYHLCILHSKDLQKLNGEFLMLQLQIQEINNQFATRANGSTRYGLTIDAIEKIYLKIPNNIDEQIEIVNRLKTIDNKIETEQYYLQKMQQIKAGLMGDLLSGRKRVKT